MTIYLCLDRSTVSVDVGSCTCANNRPSKASKICLLGRTCLKTPQNTASQTRPRPLRVRRLQNHHGPDNILMVVLGLLKGSQKIIHIPYRFPVDCPLGTQKNPLKQSQVGSCGASERRTPYFLASSRTGDSGYCTPGRFFSSGTGLQNFFAWPSRGNSLVQCCLCSSKLRSTTHTPRLNWPAILRKLEELRMTKDRGGFRGWDHCLLLLESLKPQNQLKRLYNPGIPALHQSFPVVTPLIIMKSGPVSFPRYPLQVDEAGKQADLPKGPKLVWWAPSASHRCSQSLRWPRLVPPAPWLTPPGPPWARPAQAPGCGCHAGWYAASPFSHRRCRGVRTSPPGKAGAKGFINPSAASAGISRLASHLDINI